MNINPDDRTFGEIEGFDTNVNQITGVADLSEDQVRAIARNEEALKKLQDDLRRADYKKVR